MKFFTKVVEIATEEEISIYNLTPELQAYLAETGVKNGQALVFYRHTTTALAINEYEVRLLADIKAHLEKIVPKNAKYLHNDLHLRDVPADEPINAHSHLMAMMLSTSEVIPIVEGKLGLGTWQSVLFLDLDGPRKRTVLLQICGE